jgi:hypothetical protein
VNCGCTYKPKSKVCAYLPEEKTPSGRTEGSLALLTADC